MKYQQSVAFASMLPAVMTTAIPRRKALAAVAHGLPHARPCLPAPNLWAVSTVNPAVSPGRNPNDQKGDGSCGFPPPPGPLVPTNFPTMTASAIL